MTIATILIDTREQRPYEFSGYPVETRVVTLRTADYTLPGFCTYDEGNDTYIPWLGVERKSPNDFLGSITRRRDAFENEIDRAAEWPESIPIVIEEDRNTFRRNEGALEYRDIHPNQVFGTIDAWERYRNVEFLFEGDRAGGEQRVVEKLRSWMVEFAPGENPIAAD